MAVVPENIIPLPPATPLSDWPALTLLAAMVFGEARGEPFEGQLAVAWTAVNRLARHNQWGDTLHAVLLQPAQFSSLSTTTPATMAKVREPLKYDSAETWYHCYKAAASALFGLRTSAGFGQPVTHFHQTDMNPPPTWAASLRKLGVIGKLAFYAG